MKRGYSEIGQYRCAMGHEFDAPTTERCVTCPKCKCAASLQNVKSVKVES